MSRHLFCVLCLVATALGGTAARPNIILITLDTTRADRMGFLGSKLELTPNLDTLARDSVVFSHAYSQAPLTPPSHATILTGTFPQFHQVNNFGVPLSEGLPYAPALFKAHGYRTSAFVGALALDPEAGTAPGFGRGFDTYDAGFAHTTPGKDRYHSIERRGGEVVAHALAWLNKHPKGPFFMWVHLYDAHDPYDPPEPYKSKYASALYDGEIAYEDSALGKFLSRVRALGLYQGAVIAVMADHGEALGDHGEETHGFFLYDETIHVPLLIKLPGAVATEKLVQSRVRLVDVLPTLLQTAGITIPHEVQGESLLALTKAKPPDKDVTSAPPERPAYSETDYGQTAYGWSPLRSLRSGKYLYIDAPRRELYDQSSDRNAAHDLSATSSAVTTTLAGQLEAFRQKTSTSHAAPKAAVDPEMQEKLAALGYVASSSANSKANASDQGVDPKDKIGIANAIHRANMLREDGKCADAVPLLRQLVSKEPGMVLLYTKLGQCLMLIKEYSEAVPVMRKLVELTPDLPQAHFQLGEVLLATENFSGAVGELEIVTAKVPRWHRARFVLANAYMRAGHVPEAVKEYSRLLETSPDDYEINLLLGRALLHSGEPGAALSKLKKAASLQPRAPDPHQALSNAYVRLGREGEAVQERMEFKRLSAGQPN
jgi:arylsulfatase A-like enzyme/Tfp pilus assembly protein PilF